MKQTRPSKHEDELGPVVDDALDAGEQIARKGRPADRERCVVSGTIACSTHRADRDRADAGSCARAARVA